MVGLAALVWPKKTLLREFIKQALNKGLLSSFREQKQVAFLQSLGKGADRRHAVVLHRVVSVF